MDRACQPQSGPHWLPGKVVRVTVDSLDLSFSADVDVPEPVSYEVVESLVRSILDQESGSGHWSIGIQLTSDAEIQRMHRDFMGLDSPTDIMTFPYDGSDEAFPGVTEEMTSGDLVISVDHAAENASLVGWTTGDEVLFLVAHGVLHLLGWDDHRDDQRAAMLARQHALLEQWRKH